MTQLEEVKARIGEVYNELPAATADSNIALHLANALSYVNAYSGSQTGTIVDSAVENLAAIYTITEAAGGEAVGLNFKIGTGTFDKPTEKYIEMANKLKSVLKEELSVIGRKTKHAVTN